MTSAYAWDDAMVVEAGVVVDDEEELTWCGTCQEYSEMAPLTAAVAEDELDPDFPQMLCEGCGYASPLGNQPEPFAAA
jgi:MinD superfamily P-loop ATPase